MAITINISTEDVRRKPFVVFDEDAGPGTVRIELVDTLPVADRDPVAPAIGLHAADKERADWFAAFPAASWSRVFYKPGAGLPNLTDPAPAWLIKRGIVVHASAKDAGTADQLRAEFDTIPDGVHYKRTFWHERQGDDVDPVPLLQQDHLIRQVRDDHPRRDQIELVGVHNLYASRYKRGGRDWRAYVSLDVDTIGWDCYWPEALPYEAPESLLGLPLASLGDFGFTQWEITELGASQHKADRAPWTAQVVDYAATWGCRAVGLWMTRKLDGGRVLDYRPTEQEMPAYRAIIDQQRVNP